MLVSLAVHAGALVLVGTGGGGAGQPPGETARQRVMSVYLQASTAGKLLPSAVDATSGSREAGRPRPEAAPTRDKASTGSAPILAITAPAGPYYFRSSELTRRPVLLGDAISRLLVELPGFPPAPVILRLLISDEGVVDKVLVEDSYLPEAVESHIVEAFANVRFLPGKIEDAAVRSQLRIEVRLENAPGITALSNEKGSGQRAE
jgi:hypothetical protein